MPNLWFPWHLYAPDKETNMKEIFVNSCFRRQIAQFSHLQKNGDEYKKAVPENTETIQ